MFVSLKICALAFDAKSVSGGKPFRVDGLRIVDLQALLSRLVGPRRAETIRRLALGASLRSQQASRLRVSSYSCFRRAMISAVGRISSINPTP